MIVRHMIWMEIILYIENHNLSKASRWMGITYSHAHKIAKELEDLGLLTRQKKGRTNYFKLTKKGKRIQFLCEQLLLELKVPLHNRLYTTTTRGEK